MAQKKRARQNPRKKTAPNSSETTTSPSKNRAELLLKTLLERPAHEPIYADRSTLENYAHCPFMATALAAGLVKHHDHLAEVGTEGHRILAEAMKASGNSYLGVADWLEQELPKARPDLQPDVLQSMRGVAATLRYINADRILGVEQQFTHQFLAPTAKRGAVLLTSRLDLWLAGKEQGEIHVHDYKTGYKRRSNSEAFGAFQTQFISWLLFKLLEEVEVIHFWYEQTRYGSRAYARLERGRHLFDFEARVQSAVEVWLAGSSDCWPAITKCCWCPVTARCPQVCSEALTLNDNPREYLKSYIAIKARSEAMEDAMKAFCKEHGEIRSGRDVFGYQPSKRVTYKLYVDEDTEESE